ncbi:MAG: hypothetical protein ABI076_04315 [Acidobacteriaceae bacterium]
MKTSLLVVACFAAIALFGCAGSAHDVNAVPPPASDSTPAQILQSLEAQGKLPTLDTTQTLQGTDSNGNGVRDDLDKYIAALPDTAAQKKALIQLAKAIQTTLTIDTTNAAALSAASLALNRGTACIFQVYPANQPAKAYLMEELTVNTMMRLKAYELYNAARNGTTVAMETSSVCD